MSRVGGIAGETAGEAMPGAAPPQAGDMASEELSICLLEMHAQNTREASNVAEQTASGALVESAGSLRPVYDREVVVRRQNLFLDALCFLGGARSYAVDHERALSCLREARDERCSVALAVLCADSTDKHLRKICFQVLRDVSLTPKGGSFYADTVVVACQCLCGRICELELVEPPVGYSYSDEYKSASAVGCPAAATFLAGIQEHNGQFAEAVRGYTTAAETGYAVAQYHWARCAKNGIGAKQNFDEAAQIMKQSSDKKFHWAMLYRAKMLLNKLAGSDEQRTVDDREAFHLLKAVENQVDHAYELRGPMRCLYLQFCSVPNPHTSLAVCYEEGRGVTQNSAMAQHHRVRFKKGAKN